MVFTVSKFSESKIREFASRSFGASSTKLRIKVVYNGLLPQFLQSAPGVVKKKRVVFVGNIKRHKGLGCLLEAFSLVRQKVSDGELLIIGEKKRFRTRDGGIEAQLENMGGVEFSGRVSDGALVKAVSESAALVQPSLYEGFCFPPLEALCLGTAAIVSDIPVLREIYAGFPVIFFESENPADLALKIISALRKPERPVLTESQRGKYSFAKTANLIMEGFREALNG